MNWDADFAGLPPIELPDGQKLETLADCRAYILALPAKEHARWAGVVAELLKAAEHGGPFCFTARLVFSRQLHGVTGVGPMPEPRESKPDRWKARRKQRP
jgi:hypothetical protein